MAARRTTPLCKGTDGQLAAATSDAIRLRRGVGGQWHVQDRSAKRLFNNDLASGACSCARCHTRGWSYGDPQVSGERGDGSQPDERRHRSTDSPSSPITPRSSARARCVGAKVRAAGPRLRAHAGVLWPPHRRPNTSDRPVRARVSDVSGRTRVRVRSRDPRHPRRAHRGRHPHGQRLPRARHQPRRSPPDSSIVIGPVCSVG